KSFFAVVLIALDGPFRQRQLAVVIGIAALEDGGDEVGVDFIEREFVVVIGVGFAEAVMRFAPGCLAAIERQSECGQPCGWKEDSFHGGCVWVTGGAGRFSNAVRAANRTLVL